MTHNMQYTTFQAGSNPTIHFNQGNRGNGNNARPPRPFDPMQAPPDDYILGNQLQPRRVFVNEGRIIIGGLDPQAGPPDLGYPDLRHPRHFHGPVGNLAEPRGPHSAPGSYHMGPGTGPATPTGRPPTGRSPFGGGPAPPPVPLATQASRRASVLSTASTSTAVASANPSLSGSPRSAARPGQPYQPYVETGPPTPASSQHGTGHAYVRSNPLFQAGSPALSASSLVSGRSVARSIVLPSGSAVPAATMPPGQHKKVSPINPASTGVVGLGGASKKGKASISTNKAIRPVSTSPSVTGSASRKANAPQPVHQGGQSSAPPSGQGSVGRPEARKKPRKIEIRNPENPAYVPKGTPRR